MILCDKFNVFISSTSRLIKSIRVSAAASVIPKVLATFETDLFFNVRYIDAGDKTFRAKAFASFSSTLFSCLDKEPRYILVASHALK